VGVSIGGVVEMSVIAEKLTALVTYQLRLVTVIVAIKVGAERDY
jgi:hypothetical protein